MSTNMKLMIYFMVPGNKPLLAYSSTVKLNNEKNSSKSTLTTVVNNYLIVV